MGLQSRRRGLAVVVVGEVKVDDHFGGRPTVKGNGRRLVRSVVVLGFRIEEDKEGLKEGGGGGDVMRA